MPLAYQEWRRVSTSFADIAAYVSDSETTFEITFAEGAERLRGAVVEASFFKVLGVKPLAGRLFTDNEEGVVLLSYSLWQGKFGGDRGIVGRKIRLNGLVYVVVGIMPKGFDFPERAMLWLPNPQSSYKALNLSLPVYSYYRVVGRLRKGVSLEQAAAEMDKIGRLQAERFPASHKGFTLVVVPLREELFGDAKNSALLLFVAVSFVLVMCCVNVSFLVLSRVLEDSGALAIRSSLGASTSRLVGECLVQNLLLAAFSCGLGVSAAVLAVRTLVMKLPWDANEALAGGSFFDWRMVLFVFFLTFLVAGIFSGAPALYISKMNPGQILCGRVDASMPVKSMANRLVLVVQVAVVCALLVGSGLVLRSLSNLNRIDLGFSRHNALKFDIALLNDRYPTREMQQQFFYGVRECLVNLPGVKAAGGAVISPFEGALYINKITAVDGEAAPNALDVGASFVTEGLLEALEVRLRAGRVLSEEDGRASGSAPLVITKALAARLWGESSPVGRHLTFEGKQYEVVGTIDRLRAPGAEDAFGPELFIPLEHSQLAWPFMTFVVRTAVSPGSIAGSARQCVSNLDRSVAITGLESLESLCARALRGHRLIGAGLSSLAAVGVFVAAIGIYGLAACVVGARTKEMAIRSAIGATSARIVGLLLQEFVLLGAVGVGLGLVAAWISSALLSSYLYGVGRWDLKVSVQAAFIGWAVPIAVSYLSAVRVRYTDPMVLLKQE